MFPDSKIAEGFALGPTKASCVICYGLAPFYKEKKMKQLTPKGTESLYFVVSFHEAFNGVSNQKQLDVHLIYFDEHFRRTQRLYFNSQFVGHARASDLTEPLIEVLKDLDYVSKMVQVSMDGPNVNWALLDDLFIHRKEVNANTPSLVNTGSCGLHIVHGSFGTASETTDWKLEASLKSFYKNFKDSPAR